MAIKTLNKKIISSVIDYSMIAWTLICFIGTWVIILKHGILLEGFVAMAVTFFFAAAIWVIPLAGLILLSLYLAPSEESPPRVMFIDLIRKGMKSLGRPK